jgi:hypothetical protein
MATLLAARQPTAVRITLPFEVSNGLIRDELETTGRRIARRHTLSFTLEELPPDSRSRALDVSAAHRTFGEGTLPRVATLDLDDALANVDRVLTAWETLTAELTTSRAKATARENDQRKAALAFRADMEVWVAQYGSERLRVATARGYKMNGTYLRERAAVELPGFLVDAAGDARWEERTNPSAQALHLETEAIAMARRSTPAGEQVLVEIVWLTKPPADHVPTGPEFVSVEAVSIRGWLGRYDLFCVVEQ